MSDDEDLGEAVHEDVTVVVATSDLQIGSLRGPPLIAAISKMVNMDDLDDFDGDLLDEHDDDHDVDAEHAGHHSALASLLDDSDDEEGDELFRRVKPPENVILASDNSSVFVPAPPVVPVSPKNGVLPPVQLQRRPSQEAKQVAVALTSDTEGSSF